VKLSRRRADPPGTADERSPPEGLASRLRVVDLSDAQEVVVTHPAPDRILIEWRVGDRSLVRDFRADAGEYVDPEDALWLLLRHGTSEPLMRSAISACWPDFDIDAEIAQATMPDRDEHRQRDAERRQALRDEFRRSRGDG